MRGVTLNEFGTAVGFEATVVEKNEVEVKREEAKGFTTCLL